MKGKVRKKRSVELRGMGGMKGVGGVGGCSAGRHKKVTRVFGLGYGWNNNNNNNKKVFARCLRGEVSDNAPNLPHSKQDRKEMKR